jgi:hypothetical protein
MSRYFTKFAAALVVVLGLAGSAFAQETTTDANIIRPITKQGSAAFMYTFSGLGTFNFGAPNIGGQMGGIGVKYFFADDLAIRGLIGYSSTSSPAPGDTTKSLGTSQFGIGVGVEDHFRPLYSTSPYVGVQLGYGMTSMDELVGSDIKSVKGNSFSAGVFAGFDWFFTRGLAVGAEGGLGFTSNGGTNAAGNSIESRSSIAIATNGSAHLVVYF